MKSISGNKLCKIVEQQGWLLKRVSGSHHIYQKPDSQQILSIPVHRNQDLVLSNH
jgi:predicted RNA binding protein YcfA (HicA-like mRNA interferase family)